MKNVLIFSVLFWTNLLWAQAGPATAPSSSPDGWKFNAKTTLNLGQMSFNSNWAAGGTDVLSINGEIDLSVGYVKGLENTSVKAAWINSIDLNYGVQKPKGFAVHKSVDNLKLTSTGAYRLASGVIFPGAALYLGGITSLFTQVSPGYMLSYKEPDGTVINWGYAPFDINPISGKKIHPRKGLKNSSFMSPGYLWLRGGLRYAFSTAGQEVIFVQFAPVSLKQTYLINDDIRPSKKQLEVIPEMDIYGTKGKTVKTHVGTTFDMHIKAPLSLVSSALKNMSLATEVTFFTNYDDPDWDFIGNLTLAGQINKHLSANLTTHAIYNGHTDTNFGKPGKQIGLQMMGNFGLGVIFQM